VAWFWDFLGIIDLRATLRGELGLYTAKRSSHSRATPCGSANEREHLLQSRRVRTRTLEAYAITQIERTNYRVVIGVFNHQYNSRNVVNVQSLDVLTVLGTSIRRSKGLTSRVYPLYAADVEFQLATARANEVLEDPENDF
jgi:hypothetical protein